MISENLISSSHLPPPLLCLSLLNPPLLFVYCLSFPFILWAIDWFNITHFFLSSFSILFLSNSLATYTNFLLFIFLLSLFHFYLLTFFVHLVCPSIFSLVFDLTYLLLVFFFSFFLIFYSCQTFYSYVLFFHLITI